MAVYFIASYDITNPEEYMAYAQKAGALAGQHGGKALVVSPNNQVLEGTPNQQQVVIEFPDEAACMGWYNDPAYQAIISMRHASTSNGMVCVAPKFVMPG